MKQILTPNDDGTFTLRDIDTMEDPDGKLIEVTVNKTIVTKENLEQDKANLQAGLDKVNAHLETATKKSLIKESEDGLETGV